ncbi:methylenetetrahydrofolate reductase [Thermoplasma volcanium]|nr:methylenetetrahydrofolate reductase [Thermoplasma volcanium]
MYSSSLKELRFVRSVEIVPSRNQGLEELAHSLDSLEGKANALTSPENPRGSPGIDPIITLFFLSKDRNIIPIPHITPRDKNKVHIISQINTANKFGINNFFVIGGDPINPKYESHEVREIDPIDLIKLIKANSGSTVGAALNPYRNVEEEIAWAKKNAGADFFITQAIYSSDALSMDWLKKRNFKLIAGFLPLIRKNQVEFSEKLGIFLPKVVKEKLLNSEDIRSTSVNIILNVFDEVKDFVDGIHIMPLGHNDIAADILGSI